MILEHMCKKFEINRTKIKGGCHLGRKVVTHNSKSDLPLTNNNYQLGKLESVLVCHLTACC